MPKKLPDNFRSKGFHTLSKGIRGHVQLAQGLNIDYQDRLRFHDELVADRGEIIIHEMAASCPKCRKGDEADPILFNSFCDNCENGWLYRNPRRIQAIVTSISQSRDLGEFGFAVPGDCVISPPPNMRPQISEFDRITFTWPQPTGDGEVIVRGADYKRFKERGGLHTLEATEDVLHYFAGNALIVEDENGVQYYQDADFEFEGKVIRWIGNAPIVNTRYVIKYEAFFQWIIIAPPLERRDAGKNLGPRAIARKVHVLLSGDDPKTPSPEETSKNVFSGKISV